MTSTPSTRRELDGVALWSITGRASQHSRVLAEKGLSEESSVHPTLTLLDCAQVLTDLENGATLRAFLSRPPLQPLELVLSEDVTHADMVG